MPKEKVETNKDKLLSDVLNEIERMRMSPTRRRSLLKVDSTSLK
jgi:hypothetical protein